MSIKKGKKRKNKKKEKKIGKHIWSFLKSVCRKVHCPFAFAFKRCKNIIKLYKKKTTDKPRILQVRCKICTFSASFVAPVHVSL